MEIYKNDYTKNEDEILWELHEIRHELYKELKNKTVDRINNEALKSIIIGKHKEKYSLKNVNLKGYCRNYPGGTMITNDQELQVMLERIARFQVQVVYLRKMEINPMNYHGAVSGFLAEIDRMQLEVREYLSLHPTELAPAG